MKRIVLPIFLLILAITICNGQDFTEFTNSEHGFSIEYPVDWKLVEDHKVTVQHQLVTVPFLAISPLDKGEQIPSSVNILTQDAKQFDTSGQFLNYSLMGINETMPGIKIGKTKKITVNGLEGYMISYTMENNIKIEQYFFLAHEKGIVITAAVIKKRYWKVKKLFKKMVMTFKAFPLAAPESEDL